MPTIAYRIDGKRVAGVTTKIGRYKSADSLIHWAWQCGINGLDYREEKKKAGDIGTDLHNLAEEYIKGNEPFVSKDPVVHHCFQQFLEWWNNYDCEVIWTEKTYTNKKLNCGGCPDLLVKKDDKYILIDFKTSKNMYGDHLIQLGAYSELIKLEDGIEIDEAIIVRFPKDDDQTQIKKYSKKDLALGSKQFKKYSECYETEKLINKVMRRKDD